MSAKLPIELLEAELTSLEGCIQNATERHDLPNDDPRFINDIQFLQILERVEPI